MERLHKLPVPGQSTNMLNLFSSKPATALANGFGILSALFAVLSWLTPDWFGHLTAPKAILVGVGIALAFELVLALVLALLAWHVSGGAARFFDVGLRTIYRWGRGDVRLRKSVLSQLMLSHRC